MNPSGSVDDYLKTFMEEIEGLNDNAVAQPTSAVKKRKRTPAEPQVEKAAWVPKPSDDCPIVSWMEDNNVYAVQNPANSGHVLLKMELYDGADMMHMCGLYLDKDSDVFASVMQAVDKLQNMWIDKTTGVPKIKGLTQTVTQHGKSSSGKPKRKRATRKQVTKSTK